MWLMGDRATPDEGARRRARRVTVLLAGVVLLSVADLMVTLAHLRSTGMVEANPIAAYLIRTTQSPWVLGGYKCVTVGVCVALLYRLRRFAAGEAAAWCAVGILAVMSVVWRSYSGQMDAVEEVRVVQAEDEGGWLHLE